MEFKVAVEEDLQNVKQYLVNHGCQVDTFKPDHLDTIGVVSHYSAIVISGLNENMMGDERVNTTAPIICAEGMTPEDVYKRVSQSSTRK